MCVSVCMVVYVCMGYLRLAWSFNVWSICIFHYHLCNDVEVYRPLSAQRDYLKYLASRFFTHQTAPSVCMSALSGPYFQRLF